MIDEISMKIHADELIRMALAEDVTSEDVSTNSVLKDYTFGEAELICKQDGVIAGLAVFARVFELLGEGADVRFFVKDGDAVQKGQLLASVAASPRFRDVRVCGYVDDFDESAEKQFSACTLRLPAGGTYVSFRGTDNTVVGWKEDDPTVVLVPTVPDLSGCGDPEVLRRADILKAYHEKMMDSLVIYPDKKGYTALKTFSWLEDEKLYIYVDQEQEEKDFRDFFLHTYATK